MLSRSGRPFVQAVFGPVAKLFVRIGVSADAVTITGTVAGVALALWLFPTDHLTAGALSLGALVTGSVVPYARARAEGLGMTANVGIAERADRLVVILFSALFVGMELGDVILVVAVWYLFLAGLVTTVQRMVVVRRQATAPEE